MNRRRYPATSTPTMKPVAFRAGLAALSLSLLAGFPAQAEAPPATGGASGVIGTSAGNYEFTPATCALYRQDGVDDVEIGGPGTAPDGEKFYFGLSSTGNELTLDLGADGPFASTGRRLQAGRWVSQEFTVQVSDRTLSVENLVLVDENGRPVDDGATLTVDCGG